MNKRTKDAWIKRLEKEVRKLQATRDTLANWHDEILMQGENAKEACYSLQECIDKISELN